MTKTSAGRVPGLKSKLAATGRYARTGHCSLDYWQSCALRRLLSFSDPVARARDAHIERYGLPLVALHVRVGALKFSGE